MTQNQDGITIRQMRLKVLYTFDSESKTTCLARWPHLLDIQTAYLDEDTQVGVIELRTCIQAIVSASPELVARISNDYTIYAYDYSEYETPLVGQGMLSWILAAASTTPDAPAHQSKTIVTGRVCKNVGPFSRGAQETLEVRLKLVPVPISLQTEYNNNMAKYRDTANALCSDFDIERWASFVQQNHSNGGPESLSHPQQQQHFASCPPAITDGYTSERERCSSPSARSGIEHFQALLTECATPRDLGSMSQVSEGFRAGSPALSVSNYNNDHNNNAAPTTTTPTPTPRNGGPASPATSIARPASRTQQSQQQLSYHQPIHTPQPQKPPQQQPQPQQPHSSSQKRARGSRSVSRSNSISHNAPAPQFIGAASGAGVGPGAGPGNCTSGYDSSDEAPETSAPKRAKLMKPTRPNLNIEKQRTSLLKAASNAASVRNHRPNTRKPGMDGQIITTAEELVRPPTPVPKGPINPHRYTGNYRNGRGVNARGSTKLRRHSSLATIATTAGDAGAGAGAGGPDDGAAASSSEDCRDNNGMPETPLNIPSSPPVFESMYPQTSSPGLPPLPDYDSGFMSGGPDGVMSDDCNAGVQQAQGGHFRPQNQQPPPPPPPPQQQQQPQQQQGQVNNPSKLNETQGAQRGKFVPILSPLPPSAVPTSDTVEPPHSFAPIAPYPSTTAPTADTSTIPAFAQPQPPPIRPQSQQSQQSHNPIIQQFPVQQPIQPSQPPLQPQSQLGEISRPSSRASYGHKPIAAAPPPGSQPPSCPPSCPTTDPIASPTFHVATPQMAKQKYEFPVQVPATSLAEANRIKSGAKRAKQIKNRSDQCTKEGSVPPYCQNCGAMETPTWRRAWYKVMEGNEETAKKVQKDFGALFWEPVEKDDDGTMTSFKQFKKSLAPKDTKFTQLCLCNPCGLYLYKMEKMRPENMWNRSAQKDKRRRNRTRPLACPLPGLDNRFKRLATTAVTTAATTAATTTAAAAIAPLPPLPLPKPSVPSPESSPTRSPHDENKEEQMTAVAETETPEESHGDDNTAAGDANDDDNGDNDDNNSTVVPDESVGQQEAEAATAATTTTEGNTPDDEDNQSPKQFQSPTHKRASSEQPPSSAEKRMRMNQGAAMEALKKAIQASPARNLTASAAKKRKQQQEQQLQQQQDDDLTPKPVCRNLFPTATANANANANVNTGVTSMTTAALPPKPLGTTSGNVLKSSPVKHQQHPGGDATMQLSGTEDKENEYPSIIDRIDDFFNNHSTAALDLALPVTPTKAQHHQPLPPLMDQSLDGFSPKNPLTPFKKNEASSVWNSTPPSGSKSESALGTEPESNPFLEPDLQPSSYVDDVFETNINVDAFSSQVSSLPPSGAPTADCPQFPDWEEWIASLGAGGGDGNNSAGLQVDEHNPFDADFSFLNAAGDEALKSLLLNDLTPGDDHTPATLFDDFLALPPPAPPHHNANSNTGEEAAHVVADFDKEFQGLQETDLNAILSGVDAAGGTGAALPVTTADLDVAKTTMAATAPVTADASTVEGAAGNPVQAQ